MLVRLIKLNLNYPAKLILNNKGNSTLFLLLILSITTAIFFITVKNQIQDYNNYQSKTNAYLCHKAKNSYESKYINLVLEKNKKIKYLNILLLATTLKPEVHYALKKLKKLYQFQQDMERISYIKKIISLKRKNCFFLSYPLKNLINGPFQGAIKLKRSNFGLVQLRSKKWKSITKGKGFVLYVKSEIKRNRVRQKTREVKYSLNLSSYFHL
jgi:hypothetical protein